MNILKLITCFTAFCVISSASFAQKDFVKDANNAFKNESYFSAKELYKKAEAKAKPIKKAWINFQIGECYRNLIEPAQAQTYYNRAVKLKYERTNPVVLLYLAEVLKEQGEYKEAQAQYEEYLEVRPGDAVATSGAASCRKAIEWKDNPTRHVVMAEIQLNTDHYDYAPAWGDKKHTQLLFSSSREGSTGDEIDL